MIWVDFPTGIAISEAGATANNGCSITSRTTSISPPCTSSSNMSTIFFNGFFSSGNVSAGSTINIKVPGITNLWYVGTSLSFSVSTTDSSGNFIDTVSSGLTVNTTSARPISSGSVVIDSPPVVNGEIDTYQIIISPSTALVVGDRINL